MIGVFVKRDGVQYRLDLFQDEQIDITLNQQDVTDISKVFTEYSQNFTIPASPNNNRVFQHWYENAVDNGFDDSEKLECLIELNGNPFRSGRLKLEKANVVKGIARDYTVSFFGNLVSLKDKFKEDKLTALDTLNPYFNFAYNEASVIDLVTTPNNSDIAFPLISSKRAWNYGQGGADDISIITGSIDYKELFPALRVERIFDAIQDKYNINFIGDFLNEKRFKELFLLAKNSDTIKIQSALSEVDITNFTGDDRGYFEVMTGSNSIIYNGSIFNNDSQRKMDVEVISPAGTLFTFEVYKDGTLLTSVSGNGNLTYNVFTDNGTSSASVGIYKFKISTQDIANTVFEIRTQAMNPGWTDLLVISTDFVSSGNLNLAGMLPDIKIEEFFSGLLKMFNLTCYSEDGLNFTVQPLQDWYAEGVKVDITKFCETSYEVLKSPEYKSLNFKYQKSESILNDAFYQNFVRYYGDLEYTPTNADKDGQEYKVELPFENLLHQKMPATKIHVGYNINKDSRPYTPKPILLYKWANINTNSNFYIGGVQKTSHNAFGQDLDDSGTFYTLNWGLENSSLLDGVVENTLFSVYYEEYLENIFNKKTRLLNIKGVFNVNTICTLKLNDTVIIRDKAYRINKLNLNLNKQTFNLELITLL